MSRLGVLIFGAEARGGEQSNPRELAQQLSQHAAVEAVEVIEERTGGRRRLGRWLPRAVAGAVGRDDLGLAGRINAFGPHVIVSWDARLTAVLGAHRAAGRLAIPLLSAAPDLHGLEHVITAGVDRYLLPWPTALDAAEAIAGRGHVAVVAPALDPSFLDPPAHGASRGAVARQLKISLKGGRPLILVGGGAAGADDIAGTVLTAVQAVPDAAVVALAGEDAELQAELDARLEGVEPARVLGVSDRLATLLAAADVLVDTAGGGALHAAAVGCPVVSPGADLGSHLLGALEAARPEPLDVGGFPTAAEAVIAVAYGR